MKIDNILRWLDDNGIAYTFEGNRNVEIKTFSSLSKYKVNSITWIKNEKGYIDAGSPKNISCAIVQNDVDVDFSNAIKVNNSKEVFFGVLKQFWGNEMKTAGIGEGTVLSDKVSIDGTAIVGSHCTLDGDITIGFGTIIESNVVIQGRVRIGNNCIIHSGVVIGADGFGYFFEDDGTIGKVEHFGGVVIEDYVEIGANACIDRGTIDDTVIGENSKIDNLVHIAHNVQIGKNVCVVAGAVVCGSSKIHDGAYIAPGGIIKNQMEVAENAFVGLGAVVTKNVDESIVVTGVPAKPIRKIKKGDK